MGGGGGGSECGEMGRGTDSRRPGTHKAAAQPWHSSACAPGDAGCCALGLPVSRASRRTCRVRVSRACWQTGAPPRAHRPSGGAAGTIAPRFTSRAGGGWSTRPAAPCVWPTDTPVAENNDACSPQCAGQGLPSRSSRRPTRQRHAVPPAPRWQGNRRPVPLEPSRRWPKPALQLAKLADLPLPLARLPLMPTTAGYTFRSTSRNGRPLL